MSYDDRVFEPVGTPVGSTVTLAGYSGALPDFVGREVFTICQFANGGPDNVWVGFGLGSASVTTSTGSLIPPGTVILFDVTKFTHFAVCVKGSTNTADFSLTMGKGSM